MCISDSSPPAQPGAQTYPGSQQPYPYPPPAQGAGYPPQGISVQPPQEHQHGPKTEDLLWLSLYAGAYNPGAALVAGAAIASSSGKRV